MLDVSHAKTIAEQWAEIQTQAVLPTSPEEYFALSGPMTQNYASLRAYERHYMRCKAILSRQHEKYAVYLKDCSRTGMGFISPVQLFPCEPVQLGIDVHRKYKVEITRCRKIGRLCYECGSIFILS